MRKKRRYLTFLLKMLQARQSGQEELEERFLEELDRIWSEMNEGDSQIINKITSLFARKRVGVVDLRRLSQASNIELVDNDSRILATFALSPASKRRRRPLSESSYRVVRVRIRNDSVRARRRPSQISFDLS